TRPQSIDCAGMAVSARHRRSADSAASRFPLRVKARVPGKPKPESEVKRHPIGLRTTKAMYEALHAAAEQSGRSVAQEIEFRLEMSLSSRPKHIDVLANAVAQVAELVGTLSGGKSYSDDDDTASRLVSALEEMLPRIIKPQRLPFPLGDLGRPARAEQWAVEEFQRKAGRLTGKIAALYVENGVDLSANLAN